MGSAVSEEPEGTAISEEPEATAMGALSEDPEEGTSTASVPSPPKPPVVVETASSAVEDDEVMPKTNGSSPAVAGPPPGKDDPEADPEETTVDSDEQTPPKKMSEKELASVLAAAKEAYDEEKLLEVDRLLQDVDADTEWLRRAKKEAKEAAAVYGVLRAGGGLDEELTPKQGQEPWRLSVDAQGIAVRYRGESTTRFASVCVHAHTLPAAWLVMMVTNEVSLLSQFMPGFLGFQAATIKQVSRFRQLVWMRVRFPPPFAPRDVVFDAQGVDCLGETPHEPAIMVLVRSPDPTDWPDVVLDAPDPALRDPNCVRAKVHLAGALVEPTSPTSASLINMMNVDPVLPALPGWLFNFFNRKMVWYAFDAFRTAVNKLAVDGLPPDYTDLVNQKPDVYNELKARLSALDFPTTT